MVPADMMLNLEGVQAAVHRYPLLVSFAVIEGVAVLNRGALVVPGALGVDGGDGVGG